MVSDSTQLVILLTLIGFPFALVAFIIWLIRRK